MKSNSEKSEVGSSAIRSNAAPSLSLTGSSHQIHKCGQHTLVDIIRVDVKCNGNNNVPKRVCQSVSHQDHDRCERKSSYAHSQTQSAFQIVRLSILNEERHD